MTRALTVDRRELDGFEGLQEAVKGTHFDIMQLGRGKMCGSIEHVGIGDFALSFNTFSHGVCAQRTSSDEKILIGMLLGAADRVTHWSFDMMPGDIVVIPPLAEHHAVHCGAASYAVIRLDPCEVPSLFCDPRLDEMQNWHENNRYRAGPEVGAVAAQGLSRLASHLTRQAKTLSEGAAEFWKRTIIDCMAMSSCYSLPAENDSHLPSALKLVRSVEDYLQAAGNRPLHISEICAALGLSRRSLHRSFHEIFGIGPVTFLRQKRLCAVYSILRASSPAAATVSEVAIEYGFVELGRFSHDYHVMFGEYPSQTLRALPYVPGEFAATSAARLVPSAWRSRAELALDS
jgi:AraC-like DNA-binding protein